MRYVPGNAQDVGAREEQQDAFGFSDPGDEAFLAHGGFLGVLADGMGGLQNGGQGSLTAVRAFLDSYRTKLPEESVPDALVRSLYAANRAVLSFAASANSQNDMGTTLAAAVAVDDSLYWISAGDSRIYLLREGRLTSLTTDHIYANQLDAEVARGDLERAEALNHPERESLTSYLGLEELSEIDRNIRPFPLQPGDRVIMCSDGLYRSLSETEIASTNCGDPQKACEDMVERALANRIPHQDNVTVMALWCEPETVTAPATVPVPKKRSGLIARRVLLYLAVIIILLLSGAGLWWWLRPVPAEDRNQQHNTNQNSNQYPDREGEGSDQPAAGDGNANKEGKPNEPDANARPGRKPKKERKRREGPQPPKSDQQKESGGAGPLQNNSQLGEPIPVGLSRYRMRASEQGGRL